MPVPTSISDLTPVVSTNSPAGTESVKGTIDDYLRAHGAFIRQLSDLVGGPTVQLASAATVSIGFAGSANVQINGTTTITAFDTIAEGTLRWVIFGGSLTLTHNASSLVLPGNANIQTAAGDIALFKSLSGGFWKCMAYQRLSGAGLIPALPLIGGELSGNLSFANNRGIQVKDFGGTSRQLFNFATDNSLNWTIPGGTSWNLYNQAGSVVVQRIDNVGTMSLSGNVQLNNGLAFSSKDSGGTVRPLLYMAGDVVIQRIAGGISTAWYNQAGTAEVASLTNAGTFSAVVIIETSDERKKKAWQRVPHDLIERLAGIRKSGLFTWKRGGARGLGVGAQSLEQILPEAVHTDEKGAKAVQYGAAAMVSVVELARAVIDLRARLAKLEAK
jgi:hypothetical protein